LATYFAVLDFRLGVPQREGIRRFSELSGLGDFSALTCLD
jgi:hypothetical protein